MRSAKGGDLGAKVVETAEALYAFDDEAQPLHPLRRAAVLRFGGQLRERLQYRAGSGVKMVLPETLLTGGMGLNNGLIVSLFLAFRRLNDPDLHPVSHAEGGSIEAVYVCVVQEAIGRSTRVRWHWRAFGRSRASRRYGAGGHSLRATQLRSYIRECKWR